MNFFYAFNFCAVPPGTLPSTPDDLWLQTIITFYYKAVSYLDNCGFGRVTGCASQFVQLILMIRNLGGEKLESVIVLSQARAIKKKKKGKKADGCPSCSSPASLSVTRCHLV